MSGPHTAKAESAPRSKASASASFTSRVLLLVGLPGCGKSTLAQSLQPHWHWLDSDSTKLDELIAGANKLLKHGLRVAIDRSNVTTAERLHILQQLTQGTEVDCVFFDVCEATCLPRVLNRRGHATLTEAKMRRKGDEYVKRLISGFAQRLQPPSVGEGYLAVHTVNSDESFLALYEQLLSDVPASSRKSVVLTDCRALFPTPAIVATLTSCQAAPPPVQPPSDTAVLRSVITKYPRTPHLFANGGSAQSADDLLLSPAQSSSFVGPKAGAVVVQEKVDGANLGLTLAADWSIAVQNRSHYVTAATHAQFSVLPQWLEQHRAELVQLLSPPGRYTLFGEWCRARHSIAYAALPDWFLAFDLRDNHTNRFLSVRRLQQHLAPTSLAAIPNLAHRRYESISALLEELERPSRYTGDGRDGQALEGVVLRVESEDGEWLLERAKVVRPEFVQAISEHWSKQSVEKNKVVLHSEADSQ